MDSPVSSQDNDIEVNVVSGASSPDIPSSPSRKDQSFYDLKKDKEEKATGSAPYTSFSISSILNRTEPRRDSNVLEAALAANHFGNANDAMLSRHENPATKKISIQIPSSTAFCDDHKCHHRKRSLAEVNFEPDFCKLFLLCLVACVTVYIVFFYSIQVST